MGTRRKMQRAMDLKAVGRGEFMDEIKRLSGENRHLAKENRFLREALDAQHALLEAAASMEARLSEECETKYTVAVESATGWTYYSGFTIEEAIETAWKAESAILKDSLVKIREFAHGAEAPEPFTGPCPECGAECDEDGCVNIDCLNRRAGVRIGCVLSPTGPLALIDEAVKESKPPVLPTLLGCTAAILGLPQPGTRMPMDDVGPGPIEAPIPAAPDTTSILDDEV